MGNKKNKILCRSFGLKSQIIKGFGLEGKELEYFKKWNGAKCVSKGEHRLFKYVEENDKSMLKTVNQTVQVEDKEKFQETGWKVAWREFFYWKKFGCRWGMV